MKGEVFGEDVVSKWNPAKGECPHCNTTKGSVRHIIWECREPNGTWELQRKEAAKSLREKMNQNLIWNPIETMKHLVG